MRNNFLPLELDISSGHPLAEVQNDAAPQGVTRQWMANRKPFVMQSAIDENPNEPWYALVDADLLVRRPLTSLWSLLDHYPVAIAFTDGIWEGRVYPRLITPSGIVMVRAEGRELIDRWVEWQDYDAPIDSIQPGQWFWDQVTLLGAWCDTDLPNAIISMQLFLDSTLSPEADIWSANVEQKQEYYLLFEQEFLRQRTGDS